MSGWGTEGGNVKFANTQEGEGDSLTVRQQGNQWHFEQADSVLLSWACPNICSPCPQTAQPRDGATQASPLPHSQTPSGEAREPLDEQRLILQSHFLEVSDFFLAQTTQYHWQPLGLGEQGMLAHACTGIKSRVVTILPARLSVYKNRTYLNSVVLEWYIFKNSVSNLKIPEYLLDNLPCSI